MTVDNDLKLETKCYDAMEYGYLYGLNKKIPDEQWEKVKPYMRKWKRMDFVEGNIKVTGRPEGYRCLEEDVAKVEIATLHKKDTKLGVWEVEIIDFQCQKDEDHKYNDATCSAPATRVR